MAAAVYKITPTRLCGWKRKTTNPSEYQTVQIRHKEVWKHYKDLVDPGEGYGVIGYIGPDWGKTPDSYKIFGVKGDVKVLPDSNKISDAPVDGLTPGKVLSSDPALDPKKGTSSAIAPKKAPAPEKPAAPKEEPPKAAPAPKVASYDDLSPKDQAVVAKALEKVGLTQNGGMANAIAAFMGLDKVSSDQAAAILSQVFNSKIAASLALKVLISKDLLVHDDNNDLHVKISDIVQGNEPYEPKEPVKEPEPEAAPTKEQPPATTTVSDEVNKLVTDLGFEENGLTANAVEKLKESGALSLASFKDLFSHLGGDLAKKPGFQSKVDTVLDILVGAGVLKATETLGTPHLSYAGGKPGTHAEPAPPKKPEEPAVTVLADFISNMPMPDADNIGVGADKIAGVLQDLKDSQADNLIITRDEFIDKFKEAGVKGTHALGLFYSLQDEFCLVKKDGAGYSIQPEALVSKVSDIAKQYQLLFDPSNDQLGKAVQAAINLSAHKKLGWGTFLAMLQHTKPAAVSAENILKHMSDDKVLKPNVGGFGYVLDFPPNFSLDAPDFSVAKKFQISFVTKFTSLLQKLYLAKPKTSDEVTHIVGANSALNPSEIESFLSALLYSGVLVNKGTHYGVDVSALDKPSSDFFQYSGDYLKAAEKLALDNVAPEKVAMALSWMDNLSAQGALSMVSYQLGTQILGLKDAGLLKALIKNSAIDISKPIYKTDFKNLFATKQPDPEPQQVNEPEPPKQPEPPKADSASPAASAPSVVHSFSHSETGKFHPEDYTIIDNKSAIEKYFTSTANPGVAKKKMKELSSYFSKKYGSSWWQDFKDVQNAIKNKYSKHHFYKKAAGATKELNSAYPNWITDHPSLKDAFGTNDVQAPSNSLDLSKFYPPGVISSEDALILDFFSGPFTSDVYSKYGPEKADEIRDAVRSYLENKYKKPLFQLVYDLPKALPTIASAKHALLAVKKYYGEPYDWVDKYPTVIAAKAEAEAKKNSGGGVNADPSDPVQPGSTPISTAFSQTDTGKFHPDDFVIAVNTGNVLASVKAIYGKEAGYEVFDAVIAHLTTKYGSDWLQERDNISEFLKSKYGTTEFLKKVQGGYGQLISAGGGHQHHWMGNNPTISFALKSAGLVQTKPKAADLVPGLSAITPIPVSEKSSLKVHPDDAIIIQLRAQLYNFLASKHGSVNADQMYNTILKYLSVKYGPAFIHDYVKGTSSHVKNAVLDAEPYLDKAFGGPWFEHHPSIVAALAGEEPPIKASVGATADTQSLNDYNPNTPSKIVHSLKASNLDGVHPEDFLLRRAIDEIYDHFYHKYDSSKADKVYSALSKYFETKYGKAFGLFSHNASYQAIANGYEDLKKAYGNDWAENHPIIKALLKGESPTPVATPSTTTAPGKPSAPSASSFNIYKPDQISNFSQEDYALLSNMPSLWQQLSNKLGTDANSAIQKITAELASKYGDHFHKEFDVLKKNSAVLQGAVPASKALDALKSAYGQDWTAAHPTVLAALQKGKTGAPAAALSDLEKQAKGLDISSDAKPFEGIVPSSKELKFKMNGNFLGGQNEKKIYEDTHGKQWLFKPAYSGYGGGAKPFAAYAAQAFSQFALEVMPHHVPIGKTELDGKLGTVQPMLDLADPPNLKEVHPSKLSMTERREVASEHLLDWLFSQHDSHGANLMRTKDGHIVGVDKDQCFRFIDSDELSVDYAPNKMDEDTEPYYNKFWKAWTKGDMDFDPMALGPIIDKIQEVSPNKFAEILKPYAESLFKNNAEDQEVFIAKIKNRKNTLKRDFEKFLTDLYTKRTGEKGKFTFHTGWDTGAPIKKQVKHSAEEFLTAKGGVVKPYKDPSTNSPDSTKVTLKFPKHSSIPGLEQHFKELGLQPLAPVIDGAYNKVVFFNKADFDAAHVTSEEILNTSKTVAPTSAKPKYLPEHRVYNKKAKPNAHQLNDLDSLEKQYHGHGFHIGGAAVESQSVKMKKKVDTSGKEFFEFSFKLRPKFWKNLSGPKVTYKPYVGNWDASNGVVKEYDVIHAYGAHVEAHVWNSGGSKLFLAKPGYGKAAYHGYVNVRVYPEGGKSVKQTFSDLLNAASPGLAHEVLRDPTAEEQETLKLARLLWAVAPQEADALSEHDYTIPVLQQKLQKQKRLHQADEISTVEAIPGYVTHVLKGRYKEAGVDSNGDPIVRGFVHATSSVEGVVGMLKHGALSFMERTHAGQEPSGASWESDVNTGGSDTFYTRALLASREQASPSFGNVGGCYQLVFPPDEMDRLDVFGHASDAFGCTNPNDGDHGHQWKGRKPVPELLKHLNQNFNSTHEIDFRKGIAASRVLRVACQDESQRRDLIQALRDAGMEEVNSVPVEDFVVVVDTQKNLWEKYIKPLGY